jgi:hypothetical protein
MVQREHCAVWGGFGQLGCEPVELVAGQLAVGVFRHGGVEHDDPQPVQPHRVVVWFFVP